MKTRVEYTPEPLTDPRLDALLIALLSTCFTKPQDVVFKQRRFFHEMPQHRWFIRRDSNALAAHVAIHDKTLGSPVGDIAIGGVAEVCVHPECRGRGYVKLMLDGVHSFLRARGTPFSVLFGDTQVYSSSGYINVANPVRHLHPATGQPFPLAPVANMMVLALGSTPWPSGQIDLRGPMF